MSAQKIIFPIFLAFVLLLITVGVSEANFQGTIGTRFTITGSGFGTKKPQVYIEYKGPLGEVNKVYAKVKKWNKTSITCLWTETLSPDTYDLWVKPNVKGAVPISEGTFTVVNPVINAITPETLIPGATITINGQFFTNKKPKVNITGPSLTSRRCKVLKSTMDPETGDSSLKFVVPEKAVGNYTELGLITRVGAVAFFFHNPFANTISGKVTDSLAGSGVAGVSMTLTGSGSDSVTTNADGLYSFLNIHDGTYSLTPFKSDYIFSPQSATITVSNSVTEQDFIGTPTALSSGQLNLSMTPPTLSVGLVNKPYSQIITITASGGNPPYTYSCSVSGGSGISASVNRSAPTNHSAVCTISGTPTMSGTKAVTVTVNDASQSVASSDISLIVEPVSSPPGSGGFNTWHVRTSGTDVDLFSITYGNGIFVAVGAKFLGHGGLGSYITSSILSSLDGITWTQTYSDNNNSYFSGVTYGNGIFVALSLETIFTSSDGVSWTPRYSLPGYDNLLGVTYGNGLFIAIGNNSEYSSGASSFILASPDGITWTQRYFSNDLFRAVTYGDGLFVAVGKNSTLTSPDGVTWNDNGLGFLSTLFAVTSGNGEFVAVGDHVTLTSPDGVAWIPRYAEVTNNDIYGVIYGNSTFLAVGSGGVILTSPDGVSWTQRNSETNDTLYGVTYGGGTFVAVGSDGTILQSDPVE